MRIHSAFFLPAVLLTAHISARSGLAKTLHIAPGGSDSAPGTAAQPLASIAKGVEAAAAGDTLLVRGGTYMCDATITLGQSGQADARIHLFAAPGEKPVLDFSGQPYGSAHRAIMLTGSHWHIRGLEITRGGDNGIKVEGNYNRIESCVLHHNGDSGIQLGFAHETENPGGSLCAYNEIINCDSYLNFDFDNAGSDADGFACKMHNGKGNVFRGCRAWRNSDDGWDLYETDWPVEITDCWTWHNGDKADFDAVYQQKMGKPMSSFQGNGNGFKLGGNGAGGPSKGVHTVKRCVAFDNAFRSRKGFDQNSHKGGVALMNCLAFGNGYNYMFEDNAESGAANVFRNNVSLLPKTSLGLEFSSGAVLENNSWDLPVTVTAGDFISLAEEHALAPRAADGGLPANGFARLAAGSDLIDKGVEAGSPFSGKAPDLGAFEYGLAPTALRNGAWKAPRAGAPAAAGRARTYTILGKRIPVGPRGADGGRKAGDGFTPWSAPKARGIGD